MIAMISLWTAVIQNFSKFQETKFCLDFFPNFRRKGYLPNFIFFELVGIPGGLPTLREITFFQVGQFLVISRYFICISEWVNFYFKVEICLLDHREL